MKNSPHHYKHLRNKALRQNNLTDVKEQVHQDKLDRHKDRITTIVLEQIRPLKDHLKPIDQQKAKKMLDYFVKHWKREMIVHEHSSHASKRTAPGEVERDEPYTKTLHIPDKMRQQNEMKILIKSNKVARQMLKRDHSQHHKKAA